MPPRRRQVRSSCACDAPSRAASACSTATIVQHAQHRHGLMQQRKRQRRLVQQRHDADAGLQGDGAHERQRAVAGVVLSTPRSDIDACSIDNDRST